jgi:glycosyltransferase involved in cell wall biosynthesis
MKVALVHDYLFEYGGAERVVEALHELYPEAPLYTSFVDPDRLGIHWQKFKDWDIRESWLTKIPFYKKFFSPLRLFAMNFFEEFDLSEYDVVISSSNAYFAKAVLTKPWTPHICYCHTPPRSLYGYTTMTDWKKNPVTRLAGNWINSQIKEMDYLAAQRVDQFVANSEEVKQRIKKFYDRDAIVIYPPVDVTDELSDRLLKSDNSVREHLATVGSKSETNGVKKSDNEGYYLFVSRLAFSKHPELAVEVCNTLNLPLKVVGQGKMLPKLQTIAGPTIEFCGEVSDEELHKLYQGAKALLYPVEDEDFGIVPVEAMGHGLPIIAHRSGGPKETIVDGKTGIFFDELTSEALTAALKKCENKTWDKKSHPSARTYLPQGKISKRNQRVSRENGKRVPEIKRPRFHEVFHFNSDTLYSSSFL